MRGRGNERSKRNSAFMHSMLYKTQFPVNVHTYLHLQRTHLQYSTGLPDPVSSPPRSGDPHLISKRRGLLIIPNCLALVVINWKSGWDQVKG